MSEPARELAQEWLTRAEHDPSYLIDGNRCRWDTNDGTKTRNCGDRERREVDMSTLVAQDAEPGAVLEMVAEELCISEGDLLRRGVHTLLEHRLREIKTQIFEITGRYGVSSAEEMEARYREGTLEEADSWRDLQRLDHLEYKRDRLLQLLEAVA